MLSSESFHGPAARAKPDNNAHAGLQLKDLAGREMRSSSAQAE
jgi:hypothetical protein